MQATVFSSLLTQSSTPLRQRGGLFLGLIIGVLVGLGAALVVALYVAKVPVPFMNKSATKSSAEQDAAEQQKNKDWDPNAPLYGKTPAKPAASGTVGTLTAATSAVTPPAPSVSAPKTAASAPKASSADPLGDLAKAKASGVNANANSVPAPAPAVAGVDPFTYFVQAGAFRTPEDAQAQKAKLSMAGFQANVTEREQSGRTVFRVRVGPLDKKEDADKAKERLDGAGFETAIVRVQR
ncbi:MAG: sporulation protein [Brachymonas sp.]|nr:sporulation protein [Brachymonas sp.]